MEVALAALRHEDQDGASRFSPVQQRLTPLALLCPSLLRPSRRPGFVEELTKKKLGVYVEICSSTRDENPWVFSTPPLWLFMTLALTQVSDLRSPNFSSATKEKALRILNDLFRVKVRMKLADGISQTPDPLYPPDPPDLPRVLVTSDTIMVCSRFLSSDSDCDWGFDELVGLVMLDSNFFGLVLIVSVDIGSLIMPYVRIFVAFVRSLLQYAECISLLQYAGFSYCAIRLQNLSPLCDVSLGNSIAFVRCRTALCRFQSGVTMTGPDFSLMESRFLPISSLVFSGIGIKSAASILFLLEVEAIAMKAAILPASIIEIQHLSVFMDSLSLAKFLKSRGVVNEWKSILSDILYLLGHFSSIPIYHVFVFFTACVLAKSLSMSSLLDFNISSMVGV